MSLALAALAGGSILSGVLGANAAKKGARASADASRYAADLQYKQYKQGREDMAPWRKAGANALSDYYGYGRSNVDPNSYIPGSNITEYQRSQIDVDPNINAPVSDYNS